MNNKLLISLCCVFITLSGWGGRYIVNTDCIAYIDQKRKIIYVIFGRYPEAFTVSEEELQKIKSEIVLIK